jgi:nicotinamide mononucleotide adenylyltransferase
VDEVIVDEGSGLAPSHLGQMKIFELARERAGVVVICATRDRISRAPQNVQRFLSEADVLGVTICFAAEVHRARG